MGKFGTSQAIRRREDQRFITGAGRYTDDIDFPGQSYLFVFRSPYAHGVIRRLDVDGATGYTIPTDNPFVTTSGARGEIWSYGLRNPWRASFDRQSGTLYIGDVGQNSWEEISVQPGGSGGGENYGWRIMEGTHCRGGATCDMTGLVRPVYEYPTGDGCAVTGGYVYRGGAIPGLAGHYFFADYCAGFVRSFRYQNGQAVDVRDWTAALGAPSSISGARRCYWGRTVAE